jgi:hypothetical protein
MTKLPSRSKFSLMATLGIGADLLELFMKARDAG